MPLFGLLSPNIEKMKAKHDVEGLTKALGYGILTTIDGDAWIRQSAAEALVMIGEPAVESLVAILTKDSTNLGEQRVQLAIAELLGKIGSKRAVESLISTLESNPKEYVKKAVAEALGHIRDPRVGEILIRALQSDDDNVRKSAAEALGNIRDPRAVEPLVTMLKDGSVPIRKTAIEGLGQIGDIRAIEPLIVVIKDSNKDVRRVGAEVLGQFGDVRAVEPLVSMLTDDNKNVCQAAAKALEQLGWQPAEDGASAAYWVVKRKWAKCIEIGSPAVEPLIAVLNGDNREMRQDAAVALGQIGDARAVEPLLVALKDKDQDMREATVRALGQIGGTRVIQALSAILEDQSGVSKIHAETLGRIDPNKYYITDTNHDIKQVAAEALANSGDESAIEVLLNSDFLYFSVPSEVQEAGITALSRIGSSYATEVLTTFLRRRQESRLEKAAIRALEQIGDTCAVETLIIKLNDSSNWDTRKAAAEALVRLYRGDRIDEEHRKQILTQRDAITAKHDDGSNLQPGPGCGGDAEHEDRGVGVKFPL